MNETILFGDLEYFEKSMDIIENKIKQMENRGTRDMKVIATFHNVKSQIYESNEKYEKLEKTADKLLVYDSPNVSFTSFEFDFLIKTWVFIIQLNALNDEKESAFRNLELVLKRLFSKKESEQNYWTSHDIVRFVSTVNNVYALNAEILCCYDQPKVFFFLQF